MCFTPQVSIATAITELIIASIIFLRFKKSKIAKWVALFIVLLGFYQFTEFMLCTSENVQLWGRLGFITYSILPALGLHMTFHYTKQKFNKVLIYLPMAIFILIAVFDPGFIISGYCSQFFVSVQHYFALTEHWSATLIYWGYYFGYISLMLGLLVNEFRNEKNEAKARNHLLILSTIILVIIPPFILVNIFPSLNIAFPSVYCQFALVYAVVALVAVYLDDQ
ncbi:MAG: hypothetical protein V1695_00715, partial [Candidatus Uhrbacteria bacterium]